MKKMIITRGKEGKAVIRVEGAVGEECLEFTRLMEKAVGVVEKREMTADCYEEARENISVDIREKESL